jgi:hypothetical protein
MDPVMALLTSFLARLIFLTAEAYGPDIASRLVLSWARTYTRGLPDGVREDRLACLRSDLWEQVRSAHDEGLKQDVVGLQIFFRFVRGIPADLLWRLEKQPLTIADVRRFLPAVMHHFLMGPRPRGMKIAFGSVPIALALAIAVSLVSSATAAALLPWLTILMVLAFYAGITLTCVDGVVWVAGFWAALRRPQS